MANWESDKKADLRWCRRISARPEKESVARRLAENLTAHDIVGIGSGSTSFLTLMALAERARDEKLPFSAIVTSIEMQRACSSLGVPTVPLTHARPDWSFDGADEICPKRRLLKGRGGALFQEKLVMAASRKRYIVADRSKFVDLLGDRFAVPIEVAPNAVELVRNRLTNYQLKESFLRIATRKDGPVITEFGCLILDASFWEEVPPERDLEAIPGVIATGVFDHWDYEVVSPEK